MNCIRIELAASTTSPALAPLRQEPREHGEQRQRADHDVAIDAEHPPQARQIEQSGLPPASTEAAQRARRDRQPHRRGDPLCEQGAAGHALHVPAQAEHEQHVEQHVAEVEHQLQHEPQLGARQPDEPAEQRVVDERGRRRPDPHLEIAARQRLHLLAAIEQREGHGADRLL
jgi:hypothetical protein